MAKLKELWCPCARSGRGGYGYFNRLGNPVKRKSGDVVVFSERRSRGRGK